jgi:hypothetical protein
MGLVVENGSGVAGADAYGRTSNVLTEAAAYHKSRGNEAWLTIGGDYQSEKLIRRGFDYMTGMYRGNWKGYRATSAQTSDWPRVDVYIDDSVSAYQSIPNMFPINEIPQEVVNAQFELALMAMAGSLAPDIEPLVVREKVDVIEVEYDRNAAPVTIYRRVGMLLAPYLTSRSSVMRNLIRA